METNIKNINEEMAKNEFKGMVAMLKVKVLKAAMSAHNNIEKANRIDTAFEEFLAEAELPLVSALSINPAELTGDPNAPDGINLSTIGEIETPGDVIPPPDATETEGNQKKKGKK
jgi:hypothetical protein